MPRARWTYAALALTLSAQAQSPDVKDVRLGNGVRLLVVERPGTGWIQAQCRVVDAGAAWGSRPEAGAWVARALFEGMDAEDLRPDEELDALLHRWEGVREALSRLRAQRSRGGEADPAQLDLEALEGRLAREVSARIQAGGDPLAALGVVPGPLRITPDGVHRSLTLPAASLEAWLKLEGARLALLRLVRLPLLAPQGPDLSQQVLDHALSVAFPGQPLTPACPPETRPALADARSLARRLTAPDRLVLVLVGDLKAETVRSLAEASLGRIPESPRVDGSSPSREPPRAATGGRRLSLVWEAAPRLAMAWPMPGPDHRDHGDLQVLTALLSEGPSSALNQALVGGGLARELRTRWVHLGPGQESLWLIEAAPEEGRGLPELSLALEGELRRLFTERPEGWRVEGRRRRSGLLQALRASEPAALAEALAEAVAHNGDPSRAFRSVQAEAQTLSALARTYLHPDLRTEVFLDTHPDSALRDPLDRKLAEALRRVATGRNAPPAQAEAQVAQALRQLRMLGRAEREATLRLLEAQGGRR